MCEITSGNSVSLITWPIYDFIVIWDRSFINLIGGKGVFGLEMSISS